MEHELILSDDEVVVLTPKKAITKGHIVIAPVQEIPILEGLPDALAAKMFQIANKMSSVLFETLKCHGTNILIQNGTSAGQTNKRVSINIIPRYENDGLNFEWTPNQATPESLDSSLKKFSNADKEDEEKKFLEQQKTKVESIPKEEELEEDNYLSKSLTRIP